MKIERVGARFLGDQRNSSSNSTTTTKQTKSHHQQQNVYNYTQDRKPIITPSLKSVNRNGNIDEKINNADDDEEEGQQYLLIPNKDHILVLSMGHGQTVCKLVSEEIDSGSKSRMIQSAAIVKQKSNGGGNDDENGLEWVVMASFSDGTMEEWILSLIPLLSTSKSKQILPNRKFLLPKQKYGKTAAISHITSPAIGGDDGTEDGLLYGLVTDKNRSTFVRIYTPPVVVEQEEDDGEDKLQYLDLDNITDLKIFRTRLDSQNTDTTLSTKANTFIVKSLPFALLSVCCERKGSAVNFVVITEGQYATIYYENNSSCQTRKVSDQFVRYDLKKADFSICAAAIAPNGEDMAVGYSNGKVDILVSILSQTASYIDDTSSKKSAHPSHSLLRRSIHWHSLPVKTLCYLGLPGSRAAPNLLTGGEEAVLVTWNMARGLNTPSYTLPRISKGCMSHITTNTYPNSSSSGAGGMEIVVCCMDDTIQLIQGHNNAVRWKIQGLASSNNECVDAVSLSKPEPSVMLQIDPRTHSPIMTRLPGAPGFIHWFDSASGQVAGELEVAPYNRISRKESDHKAYPRPVVTNFVLNSSGNDLITVDTMLTESASLGKDYEVKSSLKDGGDLSKRMSLVTNIKFWTWSSEMQKRAATEKYGKGMPYELISAMPNPHGEGEVDGLAISPQGSRACSLSCQDGAFHVWGKGKTVSAGSNSLSPFLPSWKVLCKITIPAGYSNAPEHESGNDTNSSVTFSKDGSVLAIAFGRHVTLWDHSTAALLNTIRAPELLRDIQFVQSPRDMILTVGKSNISIVAPFSGGYLGSDSWSYKIPDKIIDGNKKIQLGLVEPLISRKELAVAIRETEKNGKNEVVSTIIVLIDSTSGQAKKRDDGTACKWHVEGNVQSLCDVSQTQTDWASEEAVLLVLTDASEMFVLEVDGTQSTSVQNKTERGVFSRIGNRDSSLLSSSAPRLDISKKRRSEAIALGVVGSEAQVGDAAAVGRGYLIFDAAESVSLSTSQLPALSGNFAQSFMSRNFKKLKYSS